MNVQVKSIITGDGLAGDMSVGQFGIFPIKATRARKYWKGGFRLVWLREGGCPSFFLALDSWSCVLAIVSGDCQCADFLHTIRVDGSQFKLCSFFRSHTGNLWISETISLFRECRC